MNSNDIKKFKAFIEHLDKALFVLEQWIKKQRYQGYDPYDIKGHPYIHKLFSGKSVFSKYPRHLMLQIIDRYPFLLRKGFKIGPEINPKAMGLFMTAYARLYQIHGREQFLNQGLDCAEWLLKHPSGGYPGLSWGYPFDWQSVVFIPKETPSGVVTSVAGEGFLLLYEITGQEKFLDACLKIGEFFTQALRVTFRDNDQVCFSYTPIDDFRVHNANLFVGEFLARVGQLADKQEWIEIGRQCGNFAVSDQNPDGSLCYWAKPQQDSHSGGVCRIDHYHTGFEIRKLYGLWKVTGDHVFQKAYQAYWDFYKNNFIGRDFFPKMTPENYYPVNIHSCAEAILLCSVLAPDHKECEEMARKFIDWTFTHMMIRHGEFRYMIKKTPFGRLKIDIPFIRWNQAWMFRALTEFRYVVHILKPGA